MKAIKVTAFGGPEVLKLVDLPSPVAEQGDVVISVEAAAVGLVDALVRSGQHPRYSEPGFVPGLEVAGKVSAVGTGVPESWLDQRVYSFVRIGGYAEQVAVKASTLISVPASVGFIDAVALGANGLVAEFCLRKAHYTSNEKILVRGAGGGIGVATVQLALLRGAHVTAISSSRERIEKLEALGAQQVLGRDAIAHLRDEFDIVIDPAGGPEIGTYLSHLRTNGRYVICGAAGGMPDPAFGMGLLMARGKSLSISLLSLDSVALPEFNAATSSLLALIADDKLKPVIDTVYPLALAAEAHHRLDQSTIFGRVVLAS